jgi:hypothetical protein
VTDCLTIQNGFRCALHDEIPLTIEELEALVAPAIYNESSVLENEVVSTLEELEDEFETFAREVWAQLPSSGTAAGEYAHSPEFLTDISWLRRFWVVIQDDGDGWGSRLLDNSVDQETLAVGRDEVLLAVELYGTDACGE